LPSDFEDFIEGLFALSDKKTHIVQGNNE